MHTKLNRRKFVKRAFVAGAFGILVPRYSIEAAAQQVAAPFFKNSPVASSGTTLFLDTTGLTTNIAGSYSVARKLRSAYAGSCIRVRESGGNTQQDIGFVGNILDTASLLTFCGSNSGFIVTVYDQSTSANNITNATAGKQPRIVNAGVLDTGSNGKPIAVFDGNDDQLVKAFTLSQPTTVYSTQVVRTWTRFDAIYSGNVSNKMDLTADPATPNWSLYSGSLALPKSVTLGNYWIDTAVWSGINSTHGINNGSEASGSSPGTTAPAGFMIGYDVGATTADMSWHEATVFSAAHDATAKAAAQANINAFYAIY